MANKVDKDRLDKIAQMGCYCCGRPAEVHHCRNINGNTGLSVRPNHQHTIPLSSVCARVRELQVLNLLEDSGKRRETKYGKQAIVWQKKITK